MTDTIGHYVLYILAVWCGVLCTKGAPPIGRFPTKFPTTNPFPNLNFNFGNIVPMKMKNIGSILPFVRSLKNPVNALIFDFYF